MAASHCRQEVENGQLATVALAPEPLIRKLGLVYRKDKAFSKAGLGFIQVVMDRSLEAGKESPAPVEAGAR
jgi:hypothetical protein